MGTKLGNLIHQVHSIEKRVRSHESQRIVVAIAQTASPCIVSFYTQYYVGVMVLRVQGLRRALMGATQM